MKVNKFRFDECDFRVIGIWPILTRKLFFFIKRWSTWARTNSKLLKSDLLQSPKTLLPTFFSETCGNKNKSIFIFETFQQIWINVFGDCWQGAAIATIEFTIMLKIEFGLDLLGFTLNKMKKLFLFALVIDTKKYVDLLKSSVIIVHCD